MHTPKSRPKVGADWPVKVESWTTDHDGPKWVAADESGTTGEDLLGEQSVIAHASVRVDDGTAAEILADIRAKAKSQQAPEAKFRQFRRGRSAQALAEALSPGGVLHDRANLIVAYKPYVAVCKVIDLLVEEWAHAHDIDLYSGQKVRQMAQTLFTDGPRALGEQWGPLLEAFIRMARPCIGDRTHDVDVFFRRIEAAQRRCHRRSLDPILQILSKSRPHADDLVASIDSTENPFSAALDPHIALLPDTLRHWYRELSTPYRLLHDEHVVLTPQLVRTIMLPLASTRPHPTLPRVGKAVLDVFGTGSSHAHPSIQLADIVAGAGRMVTADYVIGKSTLPESLTTAVTPLIRWGLLPDDGFWTRPRFFPQGDR